MSCSFALSYQFGNSLKLIRFCDVFPDREKILCNYICDFEIASYGIKGEFFSDDPEISNPEIHKKIFLFFKNNYHFMNVKKININLNRKKDKDEKMALFL